MALIKLFNNFYFCALQKRLRSLSMLLQSVKDIAWQNLYNIKKMKKLLSIISLSAILFTSCSKDQDPITPEVKQAAGTLSLNFDAVYGNQDFTLGKAFDYDLTNSTGNYKLTYEFNNLRYWVSNVILVDKQGVEYKVPNSYYLVEETKDVLISSDMGGITYTYPANKRENIIIKDVPAGDYKAVKFSIGVDSRYNDNLTLHAGELQTLAAMANENWMWFTSYIFTSTSGKVTWVKTAPETSVTKNFKFDTGSNAMYKQKTIELASPITVAADYTSKINLTVDAKKIVDFESPMNDNIVGASKVALMTRLTDNYVSKAITLKSAEASKN